MFPEEWYTVLADEFGADQVTQEFQPWLEVSVIWATDLSMISIRPRSSWQSLSLKVYSRGTSLWLYNIVLIKCLPFLCFSFMLMTLRHSAKCSLLAYARWINASKRCSPTYASLRVSKIAMEYTKSLRPRKRAENRKMKNLVSTKAIELLILIRFLNLRLGAATESQRR